MIEFQNKLEKNAQEIDKFLDGYLPSGNGLNSKLFEAMRYSSISGGKKIRAYLVLESGRFICAINNKTLSKSKYNQLIAIGSAIEAIHSYSLIHDDLPAMDNSPIRRGKAANHVKFDHHTAILAGDGLLSWAFQILGDSNFISNSEKRSEICFVLAKAIGPNGMVGGQQADMDFAKHKSIDSTQIEWIQNHKTGALISCCSHVASILLNASQDQKSNLINYANHLGLAFQIADDLLDFDGNEYSIGKPTRQDTKNETPNFVTILGKEKATQRALEESRKAINLIQKFKQVSENLVSLAKYTVNRNK